MSAGFNSDVSIGDEICHVQTEDHGQPECRIETLVYHRGRILHRRDSSYLELISAESSEGSLAERVENQHRSVIEDLRNGGISIPRAPSGAKGGASRSIQVKLRNTNSWLSAGHAMLDVQVLRRSDGAPVSGANIEAYLNGANENARFTAQTDADGLAQLRFAMPNLTSDGADLVIRAATAEAADEIRFALRAKQKKSGPEARN